MTEKIKFKAANPPRIMKYDHVAHSAMYQTYLIKKKIPLLGPDIVEHSV